VATRVRSSVKDNRAGQDKLEAMLRQAANSYVTIGIIKPDTVYADSNVTLGQVAAWMEFGTTTVPAAYKMLKKASFGTDQTAENARKVVAVHSRVHVPMRSFIRAPFDKAKKSIEVLGRRQAKLLVKGKTDVSKVLRIIGARLQIAMQNAITLNQAIGAGGLPVPLAQSTLRKQSKERPRLGTIPLLRTGFLRDHIGNEVHLGNGG
jgi:hypothetical protein